MAGVQRVDDQAHAIALSSLLNGNDRDRPVVVVTIPAAREEPWIDVEKIAREAGDLAEVYLMPTGAFTWEFSHRMAEGTQVYGGAGRVYPVGHEWATDLQRSPLRFAFDATDGARATDALISDTLRMAAAAGLTTQRPASGLQRLAGQVLAFVAGRALVDLGDAMPATIVQELTVDGVPIERVVVTGLRVEGLYDPATRRLDITDSLRRAEEALAAYAVGDVVLAQVTAVAEDEATLLLYPQTSTPAVTVTVERGDVTTNPLDDLRMLMTVDEVVTARVAVGEPSWRLVLNDVDDDESVVTAPSLLDGGPPWLVEETAALPDGDAAVVLASSLPEPVAMSEPAAGVDVAEASPAPAAPRPTPKIFDRRTAAASSPAPAAPPPKPAAATKELLLKIDELKAQVKQLTRAEAGLRAQLAATDREWEQLRYLRDESERRANRAEHELMMARSRLRKASSKAPKASSAVGPEFADREQGFRYLVLTRWATRIPPSEQRDRPLADYVIGPGFLDSVDRLEGIKVEKIADVVFEIVTGLAPANASREVHHLRAGPGGDDPPRTRADGSMAWRASLQVNTPSARRIHYWALPDGRYELARVATHDDFEI